MTYNSDLVFTQYLYVKDEVRISLLVSILNKSNSAIFWAYELYNSGFKQELLDLICKIYYDFFATLNPNYDTYLLNNYNKILENNESFEHLISSTIEDLILRNYNTDVFMLRNICENFVCEITYHHGTEKNELIALNKNMEQWIINNDLRSISEWILNVNNSINVKDIYNICLELFGKYIKLTKSKLMDEFMLLLKFNINKKVILLSKIITLFSKKSKIVKINNLFISTDVNYLTTYKPVIGSKDLKPYRILEKVCINGIDDFKMLSLFKLTRKKYDLKKEYWYNWKYYASFSPIWSKRISDGCGYVDYLEKKVIFNEEFDELVEHFYNSYDLEPDEQKKEVQNKNIQEIVNTYNWKWFNKTYKTNGLFEVYDEELEEFDVDGLSY